MEAIRDVRPHAPRRIAAPVRSAMPPALGHLAGLALLSGSVRQTGWVESLGRSLLDLPVTRGQTLLEWWCEQARDLSITLGRTDLDVRVLQVPHAPQPAARDRIVTVECDGDRYRGTAGALRDLCCRYRDDEFLLVAHAGQVLTEPLSTLAVELAGAGADVAFHAGRNGTPGGLYLVRCGALRDVQPEGYCDLKEQALPRIAQGHTVRIVRRPEPVGLPMRTLTDVITAIRHLHGDAGMTLGPLDRLDGGHQSHFSICERDARVDPTAFVCDSVVLAGAVVQAGAVVARSIICPGAVVHRNSTVLDRVLAADPRLEPGWRVLSGQTEAPTARLTLPQPPDFASGGVVA